MLVVDVLWFWGQVSKSLKKDERVGGGYKNKI
jgi:hypothetical protein